MSLQLDRLRLQRVGPTATVGVVSLPLPPQSGDSLALDHRCAAWQPLGHYERDGSPRRVLACIADPRGVPETLGLKKVARPSKKTGKHPWSATTRITREKLEFAKVLNFAQPDHMRGAPAEDCASVESELVLTYGGETICITAGATGREDGKCVWQNVQLERLWSNAAAEAVRVGGIIYNGDTYLCVDLYIVLYATGVASVSCHFVNARLHIKGYDFRGLPFIRFSGTAFGRRQLTLPSDGMQQQFGLFGLNLDDAAILCSDKYPGRLECRGNEADWFPVSRVFNPQKVRGPADRWDTGMARTVRFTMSLGAAPPLIARYQVPAWWYSVCGEPWALPLLPVQGRFAELAETTVDDLRAMFRRGRFDAGCASQGDYKRGRQVGNDGYTGSSLLLYAISRGDHQVYDDALAYCYYWADLAVDHEDFTVHQWLGGWPWKTCAYMKFRDLVYGYLETGDPYLSDTAENVADAYWMWFRANWPRSAIGRDMFPSADWAVLRRYFDSDRSRRRTHQLVGMLRDVVESRGTPGGQMGAGPHAGYVDALYMSGICMAACLDMAEAEIEAGNGDQLDGLLDLLRKLHGDFIRDDMPLFPSNMDDLRADWSPHFAVTWSMIAARIYPVLSRIWPQSSKQQLEGMQVLYRHAQDQDAWFHDGRYCLFPLQIGIHDAFVLGARLEGQGILIEPVGKPADWALEQVVDTPWGSLSVRARQRRGAVEFVFSAPEKFPIRICYKGKTGKTTSTGTCQL